MFNEDGTCVLFCNGEIFNEPELRAELRERGHSFSTNSDVEVIVHLYEDLGVDATTRLNGQFSFVVYDGRRRTAFLARDHFGIAPLHYAFVDGIFLFASEIKSILAHPAAPRRVSLAGLDQVLSLPGTVSPSTMFEGIFSVPPGHFLVVDDSGVRCAKYWDLDYPRCGELGESLSDDDCVDALSETLHDAVRRRLRADVPVGCFVSGGLDSSLTTSVARTARPDGTLTTFSVSFPDAALSEQSYQRAVAARLGSRHMEVVVRPKDIVEWLRLTIYHSETPLKETYNVAALLLSRTVRASGERVVLSGEGADELFGGYPGYRFDKAKQASGFVPDVDRSAEAALSARLWGNPSLVYERPHVRFEEVKRRLYSQEIAHCLPDFSCTNQPLVDLSQLEGRHILHQRSYLDFKLRLADHLLGDHGDRMVMANGIEGRYPFLDLNVFERVRTIPPDTKLRGYEEKRLVRRMAQDLVPQSVLQREKFSFRANPSSDLLTLNGAGWIDDLLSPSRIRRDGYFNPDAVQELRRRYSAGGFSLDILYEVDLLLVVLTFGIFREVFDLPTAA